MMLLPRFVRWMRLPMEGHASTVALAGVVALIVATKLLYPALRAHFG